MKSRKVRFFDEEDEEDGEEEIRCAKAKRYDINEPVVANVDLKLAEKLDKALKISGPGNKPKFLTNKAKKNTGLKFKEERSTIKILSTVESLEMGKLQAKKQIDRTMQLNSVSGNQKAYRTGLESFKFNDGYEIDPSTQKSDIKYKSTLDEGEITLVLAKRSTSQENSVRNSDSDSR